MEPYVTLHRVESPWWTTTFNKLKSLLLFLLVFMDHHGRNREFLLASIKGQTIKIPDLQARLFRWPQAINPSVGMLEGDVSKIYDGSSSRARCRTQLAMLKTVLHEPRPATEDGEVQRRALWCFVVPSDGLRKAQDCYTALNMGESVDDSYLY